MDMTPIGNADIFGWQVALSALITFVLEHLKQSSWFPWLSQQTEGWNRIASVVLAAIGAVGIHAEFDATAGTLVITGLTLGGLLHFVLEWGRQWLYQQLIYKGVVRPRPAIAPLKGRR